MKRILFCLVLLFVLPLVSEAAMTYSASEIIEPSNVSYIGSGNADLDPVYIFCLEVETILEAWTVGAEENDIITFPTNAGTFDNATNNAFTWTETPTDPETLILTFGANTATFSTGSGVVLSFGTMIPNLDGLDVDSYIYLNPLGSAPATTEGYLYANTDHNLYYYNGSGWDDLTASASGNTLDEAYDEPTAGAGRTINATDGPVVITSTDAESAYMLSITPTPGSGAALGGIQITSGGNSTQDSLNIVNSGSGDDIQAGAGSFTVSSAGAVATGAITATGAISATTTVTSGTGGFVMANSETITNATDTEILFTSASESFSWDFQSDIIEMKTVTGIGTWNWADVDDHQGLNNLVFDAAASTIGLTADSSGDDLTVRLLGSQDASLILHSEGTGADAWQALSDNGGMDFICAGASTDEDIDFATTASFNFISTEAAANQFKVDAQGTIAGFAIVLETTKGGIQLNADDGTDGDITIDAGDVMTLTSVDTKVFDGATTEIWYITGTAAGDFEHRISFTDATADITWTFPDGTTDILAIMGSTLTTNYPEVANSVTGGSSQLIFEGSDADSEETIIQATDPTADIIWILPNGGADSVAFLGSTMVTNYPEITNSIWAASNDLLFEGAAVDDHESHIVSADVTADHTWTLADAVLTQTLSVLGSTLTTNQVDVANSIWGGTNELIFEGATINDHESHITSADVAGDIIWTLPAGTAGTYSFMASTLATNHAGIANSVTGGTNQLIFEGSGVDAFESIITSANVTASHTWNLPDAVLTQSLAFMGSTLTTNQVDVANSIWGGTSQLIFEGATINTEETIIQATDPGADIIWILPDGGADSLAFVGSTMTTNYPEITNSVWMASNEIRFEGAGVDAFESVITSADITGGVVTWTLADMGAVDILSVVGSTMTTNAPEIVNSVWMASNEIRFEGGTADAFESVIQSATITGGVVTWMLPDLAGVDTLAIMGSTLATNAPEIVNSVTGGTNQLIFEGTADTEETILQANDATGADATIEFPNDSGDIVYAPVGGTTYAAGAGALPTTHVYIAYSSQGGAEAIGLGNGTPGQVLVINHTADGGNGVLTPTTAAGWTSVDFNDAGDMISLLWVDSVGWAILGTAGNAAPPVVTP